MEYIKTSFETTYEVIDSVIRTVGAGSMEGRKYSASVQMTSTNLYEKANDKTGILDEKIEEVTFKIPCEDDQIAGLLARKLKENRKNGVVITLKGTLPNQNGQIIVTTQPNELLGMPVKRVDKKQV